MKYSVRFFYETYSFMVYKGFYKIRMSLVKVKAKYGFLYSI